MVRTHWQASLQEEGCEVSGYVEDLLEKWPLVIGGFVGHVGEGHSRCARRRLKDRQHQCPRRWRCGKRVIAGVVDEGPSRQCDIVLTRRVWGQVPCSRVGEQEEKNRKHRLHICECRGDSGVRGRRRLEKGGQTTDECCFEFTQREDDGYQVAEGGLYTVRPHSLRAQCIL